MLAVLSWPVASARLLHSLPEPVAWGEAAASLQHTDASPVSTRHCLRMARQTVCGQEVCPRLQLTTIVYVCCVSTHVAAAAPA